jgi:hypothetical protein
VYALVKFVSHIEKVYRIRVINIPKWTKPISLGFWARNGILITYSCLVINWL